MKISSYLMVVILFTAGILSGCGQSASEQTVSESEENEIIEIEFFNQKREQQEVFQKFLTMYEEEHPNVKINLQAPADSETVLQTRMASNDTPDMFTNWPNRPQYHTIFRSGHVMDITDGPFWDNIDPNVMEGFTVTVDGKRYSVPISTAPTGIMYNVDIFEEYGWEPVKTLDELYVLCDKMMEAGVTPFALADQDPQRIGHYYFTEESSLVPEKFELYQQVIDGTAQLKDNEHMNLLAQFTLDMRKYGQEDSLGYTPDACDNFFATGEAAMYVTGVWSIGTVKRANPDINISFFPFPGVTEEDTLVTTGIDCGISIAADTEYKDICYDILQYLINSDFPKEYCSVDGSASCFLGVESEITEAQALYDMIEQGRWCDWSFMYWPETVNNTDYRRAIQDFLTHQDFERYWQAVDEVFEPARSNS